MQQVVKGNGDICSIRMQIWVHLLQQLAQQIPHTSGLCGCKFCEILLCKFSRLCK